MSRRPDRTLALASLLTGGAGPPSRHRRGADEGGAARRSVAGGGRCRLCQRYDRGFLGLIVPHAVRLLWGPDNRQLLLNGDDVARMRQRDVARRVAVVQQDPLLPPAFTAMEAVLMGRTPYLRLLQNEGPSDYEAARRAMVVTGVWALADRRLGELSGGERQRVVVARVLAQDTPVLLLDEPTAHLDIRHQASVLGLLRALCREGKAVLAVADDLTLAGQYCDWLVVLQGGRVAACGAPQEVLRAELLHPVYGAAVDVFPHPRTGMPVGWH